MHPRPWHFALSATQATRYHAGQIDRPMGEYSWGGEFMTAEIEVEKVDASHFRVRVSEVRGESSYEVTLDPKDHARLAGATAQPEDLIRKSFQFLLEREPKESILSRFDLPVIGRYFPEYEREIKRRLSQV
jgi:hypothetical protein